MSDEYRTVQHLKKINLLSGLPPELLNTLAPHVSLLEVKRRRVIFLPGDPGTFLYFLNSGRVKISRVTRDGKELTLCYLDPGELFGELCLVDGGPREDMAETMENSLVSEVPREAFLKVLEQNAILGTRMTQLLCQRRRELERKVEDLVFKDVSAKLAELLLNLSQQHGIDDRRGTLLGVKITHQEMANLIGSTRETVSLTLSQFKRSELLTTEGRRIILIDSDGLKALV